MKTIQNRKASVEVIGLNVFNQPARDEKGNEITKIVDYSYGELILLSIKRPDNPQTGYSYDEIKQIDRVKIAIDKIEKDVQEIIVEDSDYEFIKKKVGTMTWGVPSIEFLNFKEFIDSIK